MGKENMPFFALKKIQHLLMNKEKKNWKLGKKIYLPKKNQF
jgi:hypothetical protein